MGHLHHEHGSRMDDADDHPNHGHHHHHHHHDHSITSLNAAFRWGIGLNTAYVIIEAVFGFVYDSMGLLSDAGHNLSDVAALVIAMVAFRLSGRKPDARHTYGYKKFTVQASFINALLLCVAVGAILVESVDKLIHPVAVDGDGIAWVAGAGVIINGITAWLFLKDKEKDLNVKGAYLHMAADTLVSVGVVISGIIIHFSGLYVIDPVVGIVIAVIVGWSTWSLLRESLRLSIDAVPASVDIERLKESLLSVEGVKSIHHLHVWALSTTENALTVHAVTDNIAEADRLTVALREQAGECGVGHSTIEVESYGVCHDHSMFNED